MSRIEWTRTSPDDIEEAVSMFICRLYPGGFRVRPSRGDGGIDVCVPTEPNHFEIYQVKRFASNLTATQKAQAIKSHKRIAAYAKKQGWEIDKWYLTMPLDPTKENLTWLKALEASAEFPCEWRGLTHIDGWAAKFPDIVDYYFENGRSRLQDELARFAAISGLMMPGGTSISPSGYTHLTPSDTLNGLTQLREALNTRDPHFYYDFSVTGTPPTWNYEDSTKPSLAARAVRQVGDSYVTFDVHARCVESLRERPIQARMTLVAEPGSDNERELQEFMKYGRVPRGSITARGMDIDLPGGLGQVGEDGQVRILEPDREESSFERRLDILSSDRQVIGSVEVKMYPPLISPDGNGVSNRGIDKSGVLELETLTVLKPNPEMTVRFRFGTVEGKHPDEVEPTLSVISGLRVGNLFQLSASRGSKKAPPEEIRAEMMPEADMAYFGLMLKYARALMVIQEHTDVEIVIPEFQTLNDLRISEVLRAARLLKGETIEITWNRSELVAYADTPRPTTPFAIALAEPLIVPVGNTEIALGMKRTVIEAAEVVSVEGRSDGNQTFTIEPAQGRNTGQVDWLGIPPADS
ncbi:hypothetical protein AB0I35_02375 [Nocardia sp. NPDC050378]|uniref:hypothetical protein n=1 Tax=Nocardia sp. NPDC050378 TaxID=3155400 RepID=UPI0033F36A5D